MAWWSPSITQLRTRTNPSVSVFQGNKKKKTASLLCQSSSDSFSLSHTPSLSGEIQLHKALWVWSREAVKWLQLSASSSSHKCLRLDLCLLRMRLTVLCWDSYYFFFWGVGGRLTLDIRDLVCVQWSLTGAARAGLRCNNGKPTFQKALGFHDKIVTVRCWCFYPMML